MENVFQLTTAQHMRIARWIQGQRLADTGRNEGAIGGAVTYCFTPTTIGTIIKVRYVTGAELDVTDYESW